MRKNSFITLFIIDYRTLLKQNIERIYQESGLFDVIMS